MRRNNRAKQSPYLMEYIEYAVESRLKDWYNDLSPFMICLGLMISAVMGAAYMYLAADKVWDGTPFIQGAAVTFSVYMLGAYGISQRRGPREEDPQVELRREARQVAQRIEHSLHEKRLHRDVNKETLILLEEAARNWHRARSALQSPYWQRADLPAHYRSARDQSLLATDQGMQEVLVLVAPAVPKEPGKWTLAEMADEVIGQDMFASREKLDYISPYFHEARKVAEKLVELADQVENISKQLAGQELITGAPKAGSAIEATLAELQQLKQAEDELQRDIRA